MVDCPCGYCKNIKEDQAHCPVCGTDLTPLHRVNDLRNTFLKLGKLVSDQGKMNEAIATLTAAAALNPKSTEPNLMLSGVYSQEHRFAEAEECLHRALGMEPQNAELLAGLASVREAKGLFERRARKRSKIRVILIAAAGLLPAAAVAVVFLALGAFRPVNSLVFISDMPSAPVAASPTPAIATPALRTPFTEPGKTPESATPAATAPSGELSPAQAVPLIKNALSRYVSLENLDFVVSGADQSVVISGEVPSQVHLDLIRAIVMTFRVRVDLSGLAISGQPGEPAAAAYVVRQGDTLSKIARYFYHDPLLWYLIYNANKDKISDPDSIRAGQTFTIPLLQKS